MVIRINTGWKWAKQVKQIYNIPKNCRHWPTTTRTPAMLFLSRQFFTPSRMNGLYWAAREQGLATRRNDLPGGWIRHTAKRLYGLKYKWLSSHPVRRSCRLAKAFWRSLLATEYNLSAASSSFDSVLLRLWSYGAFKIYGYWNSFSSD